MKKYFFYLVFLFAINNHLFAQNTCSYTMNIKIIDEQNKNVLPGVLVRIINLNLLKESNEKGLLRFDNLCEGEYEIQISFLSYHTITQFIKINGDKSLLFELSPSVKNIANVNVITERTNTESTMSKIELKGIDLEKTRGLSLADALKEIPGVTTLQTGPTISKPVIQGMHSNRILIINNGIRQEGQQWGAEHAPEIDAFVANKLTVIKGAGSIKYGADAIGGVILVEPNVLPDSAGIHGELNLVGISNGRQGVSSGIVEGRFKKIPLAWRVQGTIKKAGNIKTPDYYLANSGFQEKNFSWASSYEWKKVKTELFYSQFNTDIGVFKGAHIGNLTDLERAFNSNEPSIKAGFNYAIDRPRQRVEHELFKSKTDYFIDENSKLSLVIARQYNLRDEYDKDLPLNDSLAALNKPELHYEITTYTADLAYVKQINEKLNSSIGINTIQQVNTYEGRVFIPNFVNNNYSVYSIHQYKLKKIMFDFGIRYDYEFLKIYKFNSKNELYSPERSFNNVSFNSGFDYKINENISLHLNIGTAFRAPSVNELYGNGLHHGEGKYIYSNENINPERAKAIITGIEIDNFKRLHGHFDVYYKLMDGYIYMKPVFPATLSIRGAFPSFQYEQRDAYFTGVDAWLRYSITDKLKSTHKLNIVRAYNLSDGTYLPYIPSDRIENGLKYEFNNSTYFKESSIDLHVLHVAKQHRVEPLSDYKDPPNAYTILNADAGTSIHIGKQHFEIGMSVNNILNTRYREYMNAFRYFTDEPGRSFVVRLKYHF